MKSFEFRGCVEIKELLGAKADNELQLLELIEEVPIDSIYYHTHSYFLRHFYLTGQFPNDFANWAALELRDRVLGERLGLVTPSGRKGLEHVRNELIDIIENHISENKVVHSTLNGEPFYFMKSRIIEIPLNISASDFNGFIETIKTVHASSIYNHIFEARMRLRREKSDFSIWLDEVLGMPEVAEKIEKIDYYMYSLEGLRGKIVNICEEGL